MAINLLDGLPENVLGIEAIGEVEDDDYEEVVIPAVESLVDRFDEVRVLYVLGEEFDKYEADAMWEDTKMGLQHFGKWERIAVVTDHSTYRRAIKTFGFLMPGKVKVFSLAERAAAETWIAQD